MPAWCSGASRVVVSVLSGGLIVLGCSLITPLDFVGQPPSDASPADQSVEAGTPDDAGDGSVVCDANGLDSDPLNCGACGHDCLGGTCDAGVCQPFPLATSVNAVQKIALDADHVYVTRYGSPETNGTVLKIPKNGGLSTGLAQGQLNPLAIAVDDTYVYWTTVGPQLGIFPDSGAGEYGTVAKVAKSGGTPTVIASGQASNGHGSLAVAVDAQNVYWANYFEVMLCPLGGCGAGGPTQLSAAGGVENIVASQGIVYFTEGDGARVSMIASTNPGGAPSPLASNQARPYGLALDGAYAYWTNRLDGTVLRAPVGGGASQTVASTAQADGAPDVLANLAVDDTYVYWIDSTAQAILRAPKLGGGPVVTMTNFGGADCRSLAVDERAIYWTCYYAGEVRKLAK